MSNKSQLFQIWVNFQGKIIGIKSVIISDFEHDENYKNTLVYFN